MAVYTDGVCPLSQLAGQFAMVRRSALVAGRPVSDRSTLGGLTQFLTQFGFRAEPLARKPLIPKTRRDVRVVEGARLESVCRGNSTEGSNPSLSANSQAIKYKRLISFTSLYREWAIWRSALLLTFLNEIRRLLSTALHRVTLDAADHEERNCPRRPPGL